MRREGREDWEGGLGGRSSTRAVDVSVFLCQKVWLCTYLSAHRELSASPRNPNVDTVRRSLNSLSFDVWCLSVRAEKLAAATPQPLSDTSTSSEP